MRKKQIEKYMRKNGFELIRERNHLVFKHVKTKRVVVVSLSSSDTKFVRNMQSDVRRVLSHRN